MRYLIAALMLAATIQVAHADDTSASPAATDIESSDSGSTTSVSSAGAMPSSPSDGDGSDGSGSTCLTSIDGRVDCL